MEELSDEELTPSSSKEVDVLLYGTLDQKWKLTWKYFTGERESSREDEFEKKKEAELNSIINMIKDKSSSMGQGLPQELGMLEELEYSTRMQSIWF